MKKLAFFVAITFCVAFIFAVARPSIDGRAAVAKAGDMPSGLFARTIGYLPGDTVSVTNPTTGQTVDILVLGALDPSEGLAVLLSPEAAQMLGINDKSNMQVKLTKRTGQLDQSVSGSAVIADTNPPVPLEETEPKLKEEVSEPLVEAHRVVVPENLEPVKLADEELSTPEAPVVVAPPVTPPPEPKPVKKEDLVLSEDVVILDDDLTQKSAPDYPVLQETSAIAIPEVAPKPENVTETPVVLEQEAPKPLEKEEIVHEDVAVLIADEKKLPPPVVLEETVATLPPVESEKIDESVLEETVAVLPPVETIKEDPVLEETLVMKDNPKVSPCDVVLEETAATTSCTESVPSEKEETVTEEVATLDSTNPALPPATDDGAYSPIVLVPSNMKAPPASPKTESAPVPNVKKNKYEDYIEPQGLKGLKSGSFYVQIATMASDESLNTVVTKYAVNYPLVLVPTANKKSYQVMIGSLNVDEYGVVLERFRKFGFNDAFLRKIK